MIALKLSKRKIHLVDTLRNSGVPDAEIFEMLRSISTVETVDFKRDHYYTFVKKVVYSYEDPMTKQTRRTVRVEFLTMKTITVNGSDLVFIDKNRDYHVLNRSTTYNMIVFYH